MGGHEHPSARRLRRRRQRPGFGRSADARRDDVVHGAGTAKRRPAWTTRERENLWVEAEPLPNADVWRFFNKKQGSHFYTASAAEKATVLATLSSTYSLDGLAYSVREATPANDTPLYRFYNKKTGTHFYTASAAEKANVQSTLSATYNYEGVAYYVSDTEPIGSKRVWRFFNKKNGTHFYTASSAEKTLVQNTMSATYQLDGTAFFLAP